MTPARRVTTFALLIVLLAQPALAHKLSLWEIRTSAATLYLLGSIHAVRPDLYPLPAPMEYAFQQADTVVFEVDMEKVSPDQIAEVMLRRGHYPPSQTLDSTLQPATRAALNAWLDKRGIAYENVAHTRPWLLSLQLEMGELARLGYRPEFGIDRYFLRRAKRAGKRVLQLESWQQQIDLLADNPPDVQDVELRATVEELGNAADDIRELVAAWREGNVNALYRLSIKTEDRYPALRNWIARLTVARNKRMARKIRGYLASGGRWLVVVGVLHMGGKQGLIDLLGKDLPVHQLSTTSELALGSY